MLKHYILMPSVLFVTFVCGFALGYRSNTRMITVSSHEHRGNALNQVKKPPIRSNGHEINLPPSRLTTEVKEEAPVNNSLYPDLSDSIKHEKAAQHTPANPDCMEYQTQVIQISTETFKNDLDALQYPEKYGSQDIQKAISRLSGYISSEGHLSLENIILTHEDPAVRAAAVQAVSEPAFADVLMAASQDEDETVREIAVVKMTELEGGNEERIFKERLEDTLNSETDEDVINAALAYFENYSASADEFLGATYNLLHWEDLPPNILFAYAEALTEYDINNDMVELVLSVPVVSKMESDDLERVKNQLSKGLKEIEEESDGTDLLQNFP